MKGHIKSVFRAILQSFAKDASSACTTIQVQAIICELSVCALKRCFVPSVNTRANRGDKSFQNGKNKEDTLPQRKTRRWCKTLYIKSNRGAKEV